MYEQLTKDRTEANVHP